LGDFNVLIFAKTQTLQIATQDIKNFLYKKQEVMLILHDIKSGFYTLSSIWYTFRSDELREISSAIKPVKNNWVPKIIASKPR